MPSAVSGEVIYVKNLNCNIFGEFGRQHHVVLLLVMLSLMEMRRMRPAHASDQRRVIVALLASRASGLAGEHGVEDGVLRTVSRKISATSNIPS